MASEGCEPVRFGFWREIQWDSYARSYDFLARNNPSYTDNLDMVSALYEKMRLPEGAHVVDLGGGTGNFTARLAEAHPEHHFLHVDASEAMIEHAAAKYRALGVRNVTLKSESALDFNPGSETFDVVICINALYAMVPQTQVLQRVRRMLKPNGWFLVIDFGRPQRVVDWARFLIKSAIRKQGVVGGLIFAAKGLGALIENARGARGQSAGSYWLHSTEEFAEMLAGNGFAIEESGVCYRGYCDWAMCRLEGMPPSSPSP